MGDYRQNQHHHQNQQYHQHHHQNQHPHQHQHYPSNSSTSYDTESELYLPGALSLLDQLDKKMVVQLRDGRTLIGYLRTLDQFGNLVLHGTIERIHVGKAYGDIPRGIFLIRGENVVLAGEIDLNREMRSPLQEVSIEEILNRQRDELDAKTRVEEQRNKALMERGLMPRTEDLLADDTYA